MAENQTKEVETMWILGILAGLAAVVLLIGYVCFRMAFYAPRKAKPETDEIDIPDGEIYEAYRGDFEQWARQVRQMHGKDLWITSFDGLKLHGRYYEYSPDSPIELMFHGYRGSAERDLSGGVQRCFVLGHSALIVDQRCSGQSQGKVITFGVREHRDALRWLEKIQEEFGSERKVILTGISMGASTVVMAAGQELPANVIGVLADCGYSSQKAIIQKVIAQMGLPVKLSYPFVKLAARVYGGFDLEQLTPLQALANCKVPVIFFHGEDDDFVPCQMSREMYEACPTRKALVTVPGAGHGLAYPADRQTYLQALAAFFPEE